MDVLSAKFNPFCNITNTIKAFFTNDINYLIKDIKEIEMVMLFIEYGKIDIQIKLKSKNLDDLLNDSSIAIWRAFLIKIMSF